MVYYSMTVLWPTIIGTVYTTNVMTIGWQSSVVGGGVLCGQAIGGIFISYVPKVKYQTIIASVLAMAFVSSLASISQNGHAAVIAFGVLGCVAIGFVDNITFPGVTLVIEPQDIGLATGVLGSIRAAGGAIAQALYVSVLDNKIKTYLPAYVAPAVLAPGPLRRHQHGELLRRPARHARHPRRRRRRGQARLHQQLPRRLLRHHPLQRPAHLGRLLRAEHGEVPRHQRRQEAAECEGRESHRRGPGRGEGCR